jgi:hypothetical protein
MTPSQGHIMVAFAFSDKGVDAVENSSLPQPIKDELRNAKKYVEGRGIRLRVRNKTDLANIKHLVDIKIAHYTHLSPPACPADNKTPDSCS